MPTLGRIGKALKQLGEGFVRVYARHEGLTSILACQLVYSAKPVVKNHLARIAPGIFHRDLLFREIIERDALLARPNR